MLLNKDNEKNTCMILCFIFNQENKSHRKDTDVNMIILNSLQCLSVILSEIQF